MRVLWSLFLAAAVLFGLEPVRKIPLQGNVIDLIAQEGVLLAGGDAGVVQWFKTGETKPFKTLKLDPIETAFGPQPPKIYSVDRDAKGRVLLIVQGSGNEGRVLYLYENDQLKMLIAPSQNRLLRKARFVSEDKIFVMEVGGIALLLDRDQKEPLYQKSIMGSSFNDFALNGEKSQAAIAGESGEVLIFDVLNGKTLKRIRGNKDNVYRVDWRKNFVITAGQDRLAFLSNVSSGEQKSYETPFLITTAALSPTADRLAYVLDESGEIGVFDRGSEVLLARLKGHFAMVGTVIFLDENHLITGGDDNFLLEWRIP